MIAHRRKFIQNDAKNYSFRSRLLVCRNERKETKKIRLASKLSQCSTSSLRGGAGGDGAKARREKHQKSKMKPAQQFMSRRTRSPLQLWEFSLFRGRADGWTARNESFRRDITARSQLHPHRFRWPVNPLIRLLARSLVRSFLQLIPTKSRRHSVGSVPVGNEC